MAVLGIAARARHLFSIVIVFVMVMSAPARAADEEDETPKIAIGDTVKGVFTSKTPTYHFDGKAGDVVTITLAGKTAEQIGVVMVRSSKDLDVEWITGHYLEDFDASGNVRKGDSVVLTLRLPKTTEYLVFIRDAVFNEEEAPYSLTIDGGGGGGGKFYARGTIAGGLAIVDGDPTYTANVTLGVGQKRSVERGVEVVASASIVPASELSALAMLGLGVRATPPDTPFRIRVAIGIAGMLGAIDHLGGGVRWDMQVSRVTFSFEAERLGRSNIFLALFGVAL